MTTAYPQEQPSSSASDWQALQFAVLQIMRRMQTVTIVQVQAVHGGGVALPGTIDVLPLVDQTDGAGNAITNVTLYGRPYIRWQAGAVALILDPQAGDIGLMGFASRDISAALKSGGEGPPPSERIFNFADGIYLGSLPRTVPTSYLYAAANGAMTLLSTQSIALQAPNINLTGAVNANGATISTAGEVTNASGVVLGTHTHSGVTTGTGDTGPPV